jgi:hypothetical protein
MLALRQPVADDLRFLATAVRIITDLERVGDEAVNIAERAGDGVAGARDLVLGRTWPRRSSSSCAETTCATASGSVPPSEARLGAGPAASVTTDDPA